LLEHAVWIAWERQRRTTELARILNVPLVRELFEGPYPIRIPVVIVRTIVELIRRKPRVVIVQNPSVVLASLVCVLKPLFGFRVIVDRHSNFKFETVESSNPKYKVFHSLSRHSLRNADLTVVTNEFLANVVRNEGGRAHILPDAIPVLQRNDAKDLGPGGHVLYVCSFDRDEPLEMVLDAARTLDPEVTFHVSGNHRHADRALLDTAPPNVRFLGFLSDEEYATTMASVDVVLTLTTQSHTMQCGAYEAISLEQPLVFADHEEMKDYFHKGVVVTDLTGQDIARAIGQAVEQKTKLKQEAGELKKELIRDWEGDFEVLKKAVV